VNAVPNRESVNHLELHTAKKVSPLLRNLYAAYPKGLLSVNVMVGNSFDRARLVGQSMLHKDLRIRSGRFAILSQSSLK
jgi:hypothetical protein